MANHPQPAFSLELRTIRYLDLIYETAAEGAYEYGQVALEITQVNLYAHL